jgi:hypothetical protein
MKKVQYEQHAGIYNATDIKDILQLAVNDKNVIGNNKGCKFYSVPCAFDIEVSSFYRDEEGQTYTYEQYTKLGVKMEKCAIMYVWQFGINGYVIVGRTWDEFTDMCNTISQTLELSPNKKLIVYIHNLSYEFQFIRTLFEWEKVFSIDLRKPLYATTTIGIEFRCSYLLSGYNLAKLGDQLQKYKCAKMVGDLDYTQIRHTQTELTDKELLYCVNDVRVVMNYIQEKLEQNKLITRLPLTKTGYVRKHCRKAMLSKNVNGKTVRNWQCINLIHSLNINGLHEFNMLQRAFSGGFTHGNANHIDETREDVASYDFTSSYPYVMVSEKFPMTTGVRVRPRNLKEFEYYISKYLCIFDIEFTDIYAKELQDNPLSVSKCYVKVNHVENNGRLVCAAKVATTITNIDYNIIRNFYTWGKVRVGNMYCYKADYLPTEFVCAILDLYESKTKLKGVQGKEVEYLNSKEMLNSCYGMCVTNPLRDEFVYNGQWDENTLTDSEKAEMLQKYNESKNRFLFYPWGVFVTAYARRNLFTAIYEAKQDYIYSDTDSIKLMNAATHKNYFDTYNNVVYNKLKAACKHHGIDFAKCEPETIKGVSKTLGIWEYEGTYKRFKTLGAKRYMVQEENALNVGGKSYDYSLTISGVNKKTAIPYLVKKYGDDIFNAFTNYLEFPCEATGKNIHTYIDYQITGEVTDYKGKKCTFAENTGVHLEPTSYSLSLSVMYLNYLKGIKLKD